MIPNKPYESTASMIDQFIAKAKKDILESANKRDEAIFFVSSEVYDFIQGRSGGKSSAGSACLGKSGARAQGIQSLLRVDRQNNEND